MLPSEADALEARFALRVAARLEEGSQNMPHDFSERLRVARQQAVAQARQAAAVTRKKTAPASAVSIVRVDPHSGAAVLGRFGGEDSPWWGRLGWVIPALALVAGLAGLGEWQNRDQISLTARLDTELLGDALPPAAYTDAGFSEFLIQPPEVAAPEDSATPVVETIVGA